MAEKRHLFSYSDQDQNVVSTRLTEKGDERKTENERICVLQVKEKKNALQLPVSIKRDGQKIHREEKVPSLPVLWQMSRPNITIRVVKEKKKKNVCSNESQKQRGRKIQVTDESAESE